MDNRINSQTKEKINKGAYKSKKTHHEPTRWYKKKKQIINMEESFSHFELILARYNDKNTHAVSQTLLPSLQLIDLLHEY